MQSAISVGDISLGQPITSAIGPGTQYQVLEALIQTVPTPSVLSRQTPQKPASSSDQYIFPNQEHATATIKWLRDNFEGATGYSLPRKFIYEYYVAFCRGNNLSAVNAASFGKIIRQVFPHLQSRRLGNRGQSKYHYYGIQVKKTSPLYKELSAEQKSTIAPSFDMRKAVTVKAELPLVEDTAVWPTFEEAAGRNQIFKSVTANKLPSCAIASLPSPVYGNNSVLPEFPNASSLGHKITSPSTLAQVNFMISSYRAHCTQIFETILRRKLKDIGMNLSFYWQHLNDSTKIMLQEPYISKLIAVCDTILYQTILGELVPGTVQPLETSEKMEMRNFAIRFVRDVEIAVKDLPPHVFEAKKPVAKRFSKMLIRKTTLAHLSQASQTVLNSEMSLQQMISDWERKTHHWSVCDQLEWTAKLDGGFEAEILIKYMNKFVDLLRNKLPVEHHIHWLEMTFIKCIAKKDQQSMEKSMRMFFMQWCYLANLILRDQTLRSASSYGSLHLLNLLYQEYFLFVIEIYRNQREEEALWFSAIGFETPIPDYYLTSSLICDLEECIARDTAPVNSPNSVTNTESQSQNDGDDVSLLPGSNNPYLSRNEKSPSSQATGSQFVTMELNEMPTTPINQKGTVLANQTLHTPQMDVIDGPLPGLPSQISGLHTPVQELNHDSYLRDSPDDIPSSIFKLASSPLRFSQDDGPTSFPNFLGDTTKAEKEMIPPEKALVPHGSEDVGKDSKTERRNGVTSHDPQRVTASERTFTLTPSKVSSQVGGNTQHNFKTAPPTFALNEMQMPSSSLGDANNFGRQQSNNLAPRSTTSNGTEELPVIVPSSLEVCNPKTSDYVITLPDDISQCQPRNPENTLQDILGNLTKCKLVPPGRYIASRLVKVIALDSMTDKDPVTLQFAVPFSKEFILSKGQILKTEDGTSYVVHEVQNALRPVKSGTSSS